MTGLTIRELRYHMPAETLLRKQHEELGATFGAFFDCVLPERYTNPAVECRTARESVALFDTNYHAVAAFTGPDRVRYLNAVLTCNVNDVTDGQGAIGLLLNPQGHILAEIRCLALADRLLAIFHRGVQQRTVETLDKFIIMDDVTLTDETERLGSIAMEGPAAGPALAELSGVKLDAMMEHSHAEASVGGISCRVIRATHFGETGAEFIAPREQLAALWTALLRAVRARGGGPVGYQALNALRLEAGIPWFGYDFDDKMIPHEAGLETSHISYTKGCYTGQEIVERVRSRGHVNRRRVRLQFLGMELPPGGTKLFAGKQEAGAVTSAAYSPQLGRVLGMAYVRRESAGTGSLLEWSGGEAEVT
ncbi:MAG: aminomethyl transferase family protein [Acidobacteria bacterium]|nr:aminomethyl transferase family protein [Acidobacteriota bacterium]